MDLAKPDNNYLVSNPTCEFDGAGLKISPNYAVFVCPKCFCLEAYGEFHKRTNKSNDSNER